jgi:hypothetical protein
VNISEKYIVAARKFLVISKRKPFDDYHISNVWYIRAVRVFEIDAEM